MNKKDFLFLLHQYRGQDYVDIYPFNADNRKIESYFKEILEKVEEQHKSHTQLESKINRTIEEHISDSSKHIKEEERNSWNAKETPAGAQTKASKALEDAKVYTDQQIGEIPEVDTSHLATKVDVNKAKATANSAQILASSADYKAQKAQETADKAQSTADEAIIDAKSYTDTHANVLGTWKVSGHVKTLDSVTSSYNENTGYAATPYAVKRAYDKANEAFQLGVKQKQKLATSLTSKGISLPSDPTWAELQSEVDKLDKCDINKAVVDVSIGQKTITVPFDIDVIIPSLPDSTSLYFVGAGGYGDFNIIQLTRFEGEPEHLLYAIEGGKLTFENAPSLPFTLTIYGGIE